MLLNGEEEYEIDRIIACRKRGHGLEYWVQWLGYGPEHDEWLPERALENA